MTNTDHRMTSAYHPQVLSLMYISQDRFNQTFTRYLSKPTNKDQNDGDVKIDTVLMGYRASFQSSIEYSPSLYYFKKKCDFL